MEWSQVVQKFCQGDDDAYCIIYQRYFDDIYNYVCYSVGHANAEDVAQEIFVKVYKAREQFRGDSELKTWIFGIARRQISDWFRRRRMLPSNWLSESIPDLAPGPDERVYIKEQVREVLERLANMGFRNRSIVVLRVMYNFSTKEVATIMGLSEANVRTILYRSLKALRIEMNSQLMGGVR